MKKLKQFLKFDCQKFLKGKTLVFLEFKIENSEKFKGAKAQIMVLEDNTVYADQETGVNDFEKFMLKIEGATEETMAHFKKRERVKLENITNAQVWGDYSQNLIITGNMVKANG